MTTEISSRLLQQGREIGLNNFEAKFSHCRVQLFVTPRTIAPKALAWNSPGKNTGVGCHFLLQRIFPAQGSNSGLPHCRQTLYREGILNTGMSQWGSMAGLQVGELINVNKPSVFATWLSSESTFYHSTETKERGSVFF